MPLIALYRKWGGWTGKRDKEVSGLATVSAGQNWKPGLASQSPAESAGSKEETMNSTNCKSVFHMYVSSSSRVSSQIYK